MSVQAFQQQKLILTDHIESIKTQNRQKKNFFTLALIPSSSQINILKNMKGQNMISENILRDQYYCKQEKISSFLLCFKYDMISMASIDIQIQQISQKLLIFSAIIFLIFIIPFHLSIIFFHFFEFIIILATKFIIQHRSQNQRMYHQVKMRVIFTLWILMSLLQIALVCYQICNDFTKENYARFYCLVGMSPLCIVNILHFIYWINFYERYLREITQLTKNEIEELCQKKLSIDFYLLQKHFQSYFNYSQRYYLLKKNQYCYISEESIQYAIENPKECQIFYTQCTKATDNQPNDSENQICKQQMKEEQNKCEVILNAVLFQITDKISSSQNLNQQQIEEIIQTQRQKKLLENAPIIPSLQSQRGSIYSNISQTPVAYSPSFHTKQNQAQLDNQSLNLNYTDQKQYFPSHHQVNLKS